MNTIHVFALSFQKRINILLLILSLLICNSSFSQNLNWAYPIGGANNGSNEHGRFTLNDAAGNVITVGHFQGTADFDPSAGTYNLTSSGTASVYIAKYTVDRTLLWAKKIDNLTSGAFNDRAIDSQGNIYLLGNLYNNVNFNTSGGSNIYTYVNTPDGAYNTFIAKYDPSGNLVWVNNFPKVYKLTIDNNDNIYTLGTYQQAIDVDISSSSQYLLPAASQATGNVYFTKYDKNLNFQFAKYLPVTGSSSWAWGYSILTDNASLIISGNYTGEVDFDPSAAVNNIAITSRTDTYFAKYNLSNGDLIWAKAIEHNSGNDFITAALDAAGSLYIGGTTNSTSMDFDPTAATYPVTGTTTYSFNAYMAKYDNSGNVVWADYFEGMALLSLTAGANNIYLHACGNLNVDLNPAVGQQYPLPYGGDFIGGYNLATGGFKWATTIGARESTGYSFNLVYNNGGTVSVDAQENVYASGMFSLDPSAPTLDIDPTPNSYVVTIRGMPNDAFLVKYSPHKLDFTTNKTSYCQGETVSINYSPYGYYPVGNQYTFLLSDPSGSFASPTTLSVQTSSTSGSFNYVLPGNIPGGTGYKIRMSASNPTFVPVIEKTISINANPVALTISGPASVCANAVGVVYNVTNTSGSSYNWSAPSGATITAGTNSNSVTVKFTNYTVAGNITVLETNSASCAGTQASKSINSLAVPVTSVITGSASACGNATAVSYSVVNTASSTYTWVPPTGGTVATGAGLNSITVNFSNFTVAGDITVTETASNSCVGTTVFKNITPLAVPVTSVITGNASVCGNATAVNYSVINTASSTYTWAPPTGGTVATGAGSNLVKVNFNNFTVAGDITVTETASNSCVGTTVLKNITPLVVPVTSIITGNASVCGNATSVSYSVVNTASSTYTWVPPTGGTVATGAGLNSITVNYSGFTVAGDMKVTETASNTCVGTTVLKNITPLAVPATSVITGNTSVCGNATAVSYSVVNTASSTYTWVPPTGATVASGAGSNDITVNFNNFTVAGNISVTETGSNSCVGTTVLKNITPLTVPVTSVITGNTSVCGNATAVSYSVVNTASSTYTWVPPTGGTVATGAGLNSITVNFTGFTVAGDIKVTETASNSCVGTTVLKNITPLAVPVTNAISGSTNFCANAAGMVYSVTEQTGSQYLWTVPTGMTITSATNTAAITIKGSNFSTNGNITVKETNGGCTGNTVTLAITALPAPVITGKASVCRTESGVSYSVPNTAGSVYTWTIPLGTVVVGPTDKNTITLDYVSYSTSMQILVLENNGVGCIGSSPISKNITALATPILGTISGPLVNCTPNMTLVYTTGFESNVSFLWTLPSNADQSTVKTNNNLQVIFTDDYQANLQLTKTNNTTSCTAESFFIVKSAPHPSVTGPTTVCGSISNSGGYNYATPQEDVGTTYSWTYTDGGTTKFSGTGRTTLLGFTNLTSTGYVRVQVTKNGCVRNSVLNVNPRLSPNPPTVVGPNFLCPGHTSTIYKLDHVNAGYSYLWSNERNSFFAPIPTTTDEDVYFDGTNIVNTSSADKLIVKEIYVPEACTVYKEEKVIYGNKPTVDIEGPKSLCTLTPVTYSIKTPNPTSQYIWIADAPAQIISGSNTPSIVAKLATASTGVIKVKETNELGCESYDSYVLMDYQPAKYSISSQKINCAIADYSLPIKMANYSSDISKVELCLTYNSSMASLATTGPKYTVGTGLMTSSYTAAIVTLTETTPGTINITIVPPSGQTLYLYNTILNLNFTPNYTNMAVGDKNMINSCSIKETYSNGTVINCYSFSSFVERVDVKTTLVGTLKLRGDGILLGYDASDPSKYIPSTVSGTNLSDCSGLSGSLIPDLSGNFTHSIANGDYIKIQRDIAASQDVSTYINAQDASNIYKLVHGSNDFTMIYDVLAADVNQDGKLTDDDYNQVLNRSITPNKGFTKEGNTIPTRDWIFIEETSILLSNQTYRAETYSTMFPPAFQFDAAKTLPLQPECFPVRKATNGSCENVQDATYQGVLMGDVTVYSLYPSGPQALKFLNQPNAGMRVATVDSAEYSMTIDLSKATDEGNGKVKFPLYISASNKGQSIDLHVNYDQSKVTIDTVEGAINDINKDIIYAWGDDNDKLRISGFTPTEFYSNVPVLYIVMDLNGNNLASSLLGSLDVTLINGENSNGNIIAPLATSVTEANSLDQISTHPNPSSGSITVKGMNEKEYSFSIINSLGTVIMKENNYSSPQINIKDFSNGVYYLKIEHLENSKTFKIILQR